MKQLEKLRKTDIVFIVESLGFKLDYDQWEVENKEWMRFHLKDENLQEKDFTLIWWKDVSINVNLMRAGNILFKAGQKQKALSINQYTDLKV